jgi:hypothetical protein
MSEVQEAEEAEEVQEAARETEGLLKNSVNKIYALAARHVKACRRNSGSVASFLECIDSAEEPAIREASRKIVLGVINQSTGLQLDWRGAKEAAEEGKLGDIIIEAT